MVWALYALCVGTSEVSKGPFRDNYYPLCHEAWMSILPYPLWMLHWQGSGLHYTWRRHGNQHIRYIVSHSSKQVMRVVDYAHFALNKFESLNIALWYNALPFDHIQPCFPHIFNQAQPLHEFLSQPQCALSIATFGQVKFLNIENRYSLSHVSREM